MIQYSDTQKSIQRSVKDLVKKHILPFYKEWDDKQYFPLDLFKILGKMGIMGVLIPEKYGGSELTYKEYVKIIEEISKIDPSIGLSVAAHNSLCLAHIYKFGNEYQKKKWLPKLCSGKQIGAWALTEQNTGSDSGNMKTKAVKVGNEWILNGSKNFITHGISASITVVVVRTGNKNNSSDMSAFVVERGTKGFFSGKKEDKLGMRASETSEIIFDNCRIPQENLLGEIGEGFIQSMKILDGGRISIAALALGISKGAYQNSLKYSKERIQFKIPISNHQSIAFILADMYSKIMASELLIYKAVDKIDRFLKVTKESSMAKYYSSEVSVDISNLAVQIFGGYGYIKDFPVEKFYRDSKLTTIGEGTSQIQLLVISKEILK